MRLISLNCWGGKKSDLIENFFLQHRDTTDFFCFQEVFGFQEKLETLLPDFHVWHATAEMGGYPRHNAIFIRKEHNTEYSDLGDGLQHVLVTAPQHISILNFHALWLDGNKVDNPEILEQTNRIADILQRTSPPLILAGDFNLWPETESIAIIERAKMRNLIKDYSVSSTRPKDFPFPNPFADYIFTSPEIAIQSFQAMPDEVSDHLPLALEFRIP